MIISFSVENFRSICNKQTLSLVHDQTIKDFEEPIIKNIGEGIPELLRSVVIYGANAAGKSNLFHALHTMRQLILSSEKNYTYGDKIESMKPFLLDKDSYHKPCVFDLTFIVDKIKYNYTFSATEDRIEKEILSAYPNNNKQVWFERIYNEEINQYSWKFSSYFKFSKGLNENTLENVLFFSKAVKENNDQLKSLQSFFFNKLDIISKEFLNYTTSNSEPKKQRILDFLRNTDETIKDILLTPKLDDIKIIRNNLETGENIEFNLIDESNGIKQLLNKICLFIESLDNGSVLFVDDLDTSLHNEIIKYLIYQFNNEISNPNNSQLIFTIHNPIALDSNLLRRDQVFFINKNEGRTEIQSLKQSKKNNRMVRKGENIMGGYLNGDYSTIPEIKNFTNIL